MCIGKHMCVRFSLLTNWVCVCMLCVSARVTYLPKTISFGRRDLAVCENGCRATAAEIEFDIKFIGLIYRPPDMRRCERERYGNDVDIRLVEFGLQDAYAKRAKETVLGGRGQQTYVNE